MPTSEIPVFALQTFGLLSWGVLGKLKDTNIGSIFITNFGFVTQ